MNPEGADLLQTGLGERDEVENEPLIESDNDDSGENDNGGSKSSANEESLGLSFLCSSMTKKQLRGQP